MKLLPSRARNSLTTHVKTPRESEHDTAENGSFGLSTAALNSTSLAMPQNPSLTALGARLPLPFGSTGRNSRGAKKAPLELVRTRGALLCYPSTRDAVKAIPAIQTVNWVPEASLFSVVMETVKSMVGLSWCEPTKDEAGQPGTLCRRSGLAHLVTP